MDEQDDHQTGCGGDGSSYDPSGCQEAIHTLYHFLDGELTEQRRQQISEHLVECSPCLEAFDFEAELKLVIARKCRDQVPQALRDRVYRALMDASGKPFSGEYQGKYHWE
jgi:mycothiol system anti-sigma-R factor